MPPKPSFSLEQLVAAFSDEKVIEALAKALQPVIQTVVDTGIDRLQKELNKRDARIEQLSKQNAALSTKLQNQAEYLNQLETYTKLDNLVIQGVPLSSYAEAAASNESGEAEDDDGADAPRRENSATTETLVLDLFEKRLGVKVCAADISTCHRLRKSPKQPHPPIIVRFANRKARDLVIGARRKLREVQHNSVYINEHLTRVTSAVYANARKLVKEKKLSKAWTYHGNVVVKNNDGDIINIKSQATLDSL